ICVDVKKRPIDFSSYFIFSYYCAGVIGFVTGVVVLEILPLAEITLLENGATVNVGILILFEKKAPGPVGFRGTIH
ncbi:MAG: hypothetical protein Q4D76_17980, partial [Oscillospiraceae bacterium]|nr:hypothetical protein [Oscillospiraceae bacterium]